MRLRWALLSLCSSAQSKRFSRPLLFVNRGNIGSFMQTTQHKRSLGDETSHQNTKRRMINTSQDERNRSNSDLSGKVGFHQRSPYEIKLGKTIHICKKCNGESKVRANLGKKARAKRKEKMLQTGNTDIQFPTKPCNECDASGLVAIDLNSDDAHEYDNAASSEELSGVSVAIVGGGIGGVALAAALQHRNIPCKIYERDTSFEERKQGYGLTMQQGARALRALGFFTLIDDDGKEESNELVNESEKEQGVKPTKFGIHSTRHVVHKPDGTVVGEWGMKVWGGRFEKNGKKHAKRQNAHISRQNLRSLLMEMLRPDTIQWGYKFIEYSTADEKGHSDDDVSNGSNTLQLKFRRRGLNGDHKDDQDVTTHATILVGCDGLRSAVRAQKLGSDVAPLRYLDCIVILGISQSPPNSHLTDGETVFQTADGITRLYAMPFAKAGEEASVLGDSFDINPESRGLSMWQLSFPMDESDAKTLSSLGPAALKEEALKRCSSWHDPIPQLLNNTPQDLITGYPCYDRDLVDKDCLRHGCDNTDPAAEFVTILGDAAHPMSPFKGQGANQALLDAVLLARKIHSVVRKNQDENQPIHERIPTALSEFEDEMIQRSSVKVKKSAEAAKFLHSEVAISEGNVTRGAAAAK
mmetsp:Transcript_26419/g.41454  ORF Transcript_26419/g.41454 Transcript_26419/m.41454 type:complete len:639 (+) Transcript_26419:319-2235(+)